MASPSPSALVDQAIFEFTMGEHVQAQELLDEALRLDPALAAAWLTRAEIHLERRELDPALTAAERARELAPEDVYVQTTLSRIWMERGDKAKAEHFGAQARLLGWKAQLREEAPPRDHPSS